MGLSFQYKGNRGVYPRFRNKPYKDVTLSCNLNTSINMLRGLFRERSYIERGIYSAQDLAMFENELRRELRGGR